MALGPCIELEVIKTCAHENVLFLTASNIHAIINQCFSCCFSRKSDTLFEENNLKRKNRNKTEPKKQQKNSYETKILKTDRRN